MEEGVGGVGVGGEPLVGAVFGAVRCVGSRRDGVTLDVFLVGEADERLQQLRLPVVQVVEQGIVSGSKAIYFKLDS